MSAGYGSSATTVCFFLKIQNMGSETMSDSLILVAKIAQDLVTGLESLK